MPALPTAPIPALPSAPRLWSRSAHGCSPRTTPPPDSATPVPSSGCTRRQTPALPTATSGRFAASGRCVLRPAPSQPVGGTTGAPGVGRSTGRATSLPSFPIRTATTSSQSAWRWLANGHNPQRFGNHLRPDRAWSGLRDFGAAARLPRREGCSRPLCKMRWLRNASPSTAFITRCRWFRRPPQTLPRCHRCNHALSICAALLCGSSKALP